ncbi:MAG: HDIG domain-containing protein [Syntrophales bacterium]|nr:HDIG domain-containing protein [Syntrophales bacterium]
MVKKNGIPSREQCHALMADYAMLPNIAAHSVMVMEVALAITDNVISGVEIDRELVAAASLLHDITKTRSLRTNEWHSVTGGRLLRELGYAAVAEIVEQHVTIGEIDPYGALEEREIVYYADKRVLHDRIVTIEDRLNDLVERYGTTPEIRRLILENRGTVLAIERKIAGFLRSDLHQVVDDLRSLWQVLE